MNYVTDLKNAIRQNDIEKVNEICDKLHFSSGLDYNQVYQMVKREMQITKPDWEEILLKTEDLA
jgi:CRISPR/Cas system CSM-associated protein Csm2 small subunit